MTSAGSDDVRAHEVSVAKHILNKKLTAPFVVRQEDLEAWGRALGKSLDTPYWLALHGTLGAGKSVLARAIARGLGVSAEMPSPTFNLLYRYEGDSGIGVVHADLYRLTGPADLDELGWTDLGDEREVILVEWPERAGPRLGLPRMNVHLSLGPAPHLRHLAWNQIGPASFEIPTPPGEPAS